MYDNYAKIRDAKGLSDFEVAKRAGISRAALSRWKQGKSAPSKTTRYKICHVLGIPPAMHFTGDNGKLEFVIENMNVNKSDLTAQRIAQYAIRLSNGNLVSLTDEQYMELQKSIDAFIDAWIYTHIKE